MKRTIHRPTFHLLLTLAVLTLSGGTAAQEPASALSSIKAPEPAVAERITLQGEFVRTAYNKEGFVNLGYRIANGSLGEDWMYLQVGLCLQDGMKYQTLKREAFSLRTPDGKTIPLATQREYGEALGLAGLNQRAKAQKDSLSYFPPGVTRANAFQFFADLGKGNPLSFDQVDVADNRASFGRLFFKIPGGIQPGQHWLVVKFASSEVHVPFRIFTKEEEKEFRKTWENFKKEFDAAQEK
ncbi:MAG: hypothetical protein IPL90_18065 [Holophagales bacterium]|nr:hypothetical protein [Holophagales bacterium]